MAGIVPSNLLSGRLAFHLRPAYNLEQRLAAQHAGAWRTLNATSLWSAGPVRGVGRGDISKPGVGEGVSKVGEGCETSFSHVYFTSMITANVT